MQTMLSGLLKLDPPERLGGTLRGTESIRCHPFFWGLNWEALEARELTPPYTAHCAASNKAITAKFDESARAGTLKVLPLTRTRTRTRTRTLTLTLTLALTLTLTRSSSL